MNKHVGGVLLTNMLKWLVVN